MIIGYCRVSTKEQEVNGYGLESQEKEILERYSDAVICKEAYTGKTIHRPVFETVVGEVLKSGDTLVVSKLDRLARNLKEGIEVIEDLFNKGIRVHVLNIGLLENTTTGKFFIQTLLAVAEMERSMILERTAAGREVARQREDYQEGRPKKYSKERLDHALSLLTINGGNYSYKEVERMLGISKSTLIREVNRRKKDQF